jgi:hypothetical protein
MTVQLESSSSSPASTALSSSSPSQTDHNYISLLSTLEKNALDACCLVQHQFISAKPARPPPPLFLQLSGAHAARGEAALDSVQTKGLDLCSVAMCKTVLSMTNATYFENLLCRYPKFVLVVDCFGSVEKPRGVERQSDGDPSYRAFPPCDEEICEAVKYLTSRGFTSRLIISSSVTSKLNMKKYGGAGYYHVQMSTTHRLARHGISADCVQQMTCSNLISFVTWHIPPPALKVEAETFRCFVCGAESTFGEHYEKFEFLYCTSKCLREHAKRKFAK